MKRRYICTECNTEHAKWLGCCPACNNWNTIVEQDLSTAPKPSGLAGYKEPQELSYQTLDEYYVQSSGNTEFDRILGGGIAQGSTLLMSGDPGIGKSTMMLQIASTFPDLVLYVSGEETAQQITARAKRLGVTAPTKSKDTGIKLMCETVLEHVLHAIQQNKPKLVIIDSIQTIQAASLSGLSGFVTQIRNAVQELISYTRSIDASLIILAHVTKDRDIAGPKMLEHSVDAVLFLEQGDNDIRVLRVLKNRHGSSNEIGLFTMKPDGLHPVQDPSSIFLSSRECPPPNGIAFTPIYEGSRFFLVEIQALSTAGNVVSSRVFSDKIDARRISRIAAVLEKHTNVRLSDKDIYINVAGGIRINDVGIDVAIALALYSSYTGKSIPADTVVIGELSLAGEVRPVSRLLQRVRACRDMKVKLCIIPAQSTLDAVTDIHVVAVSTLQDILNLVFKDLHTVDDANLSTN